MKKRFIKETSEKEAIVDKETGELREYKETRYVTISDFIMVFFAGYPQVFKLTGQNIKVLMCCWKYSTYNPHGNVEGNIVHNNSMFKEHCREEGLELSDASIDNAISALCRERLLLRRCKGEYLLNPLYFFKGSLSEKSKLEMKFVVKPKID